MQRVFSGETKETFLVRNHWHHNDEKMYWEYNPINLGVRATVSDEFLLNTSLDALPDIHYQITGDRPNTGIIRKQESGVTNEMIHEMAIKIRKHNLIDGEKSIGHTDEEIEMIIKHMEKIPFSQGGLK